jgi:phytoene desaturase
VVVVEAEAVPGGRCGTASVGGYRFDTGPSVLTMPEVVRACVGAAGEELEDWLELDPLDPIYRIGFHDGSRLDVVPGAERMAAEVERLAGPEEAARYLAFRGHLGRMVEAEWGPFIDRNWNGPADLLRPLALARLARLGGFRRLHHLVATHLADWRLRRAHTFQALYAGLSPFDALGIYAVIAHMDTVGGAFFPRRGGMHALPQALAGVAEKAGAGFRYATRVERVEGGTGGVSGVVLAGGERLAAADVVVTGDLPAAYAHLLPPAASDWRVRRRRLHYSPSCYLVHLGLTRTLEGQAHHTVHLGRDWKAGFEALTRHGQVQPDPSLLVTHPSPRDPDAAPPGGATLFVLEPTPNTRAALDWARVGPRLRERLYARLAGLGYGDLRRDSAVELVVDPPAWEAMGLSTGTPFSLDHRFGQTGWLRPANASATVPGLCFAGMGTVPGVGVPMVLLSGRLAAQRVLSRRPG